MSKLVVANWKMNPATFDEARKLIGSWEHGLRTLPGKVGVVVAAPFIFLGELSGYLKNISLAAQNVSWADSGALTGEISAGQLRALGVSHVIIGHSERRLYLGETDSMVNAKLSAILSHKLTPILCLGGEEGAIATEMRTLVTKQFIRCTKGLNAKQLAKIIYVYEPVWAISSMKKSHAANGEHARDLIEHIYQLLEHRMPIKHARKIPVLYGGTVNQNNVHEYAKYPEIGGALVGAASLDAENFWHVVEEFNREAIHK